MSRGQVSGGARHAVAQARRSGCCVARLTRPAVHRHRVDVVQEDHIRAQLFHVAAHLQQHRDGAQAAHDAADAERVGDRLAQAVALGNLEIHHRRRADSRRPGSCRWRSRRRPARRGGRWWPSIVRLAPSASATRRRDCFRVCAAARASISCRLMAESANSGKLRMSVNKRRAKTVLPAPMNAILAMRAQVLIRRPRLKPGGTEAQ